MRAAALRAASGEKAAAQDIPTEQCKPVLTNPREPVLNEPLGPGMSAAPEGAVTATTTVTDGVTKRYRALVHVRTLSNECTLTDQRSRSHYENVRYMCTRK